MFDRAVQAVQTFRQGIGTEPQEPLVENDPLYATSSDAPVVETPTPEEGQQSEQERQYEELQEKVERLQTVQDTRLADKDRFISHLEQQVQTLGAVADTAAPGRETQQIPNPVLDEDTAALFTEKYKDDPAKAMVALANHLERRSINRADATLAHRDQQAQNTAHIQAAERNVQRQVALAITNLGDAAIRVVGDFENLTASGTGSAADYGNTWLGREILQDNTLAISPQGVYRLIQLKVMQDQGNTEEPTVQPTTAVTHGVMRPAAPSRTVAPPPQESDTISPEDQIANAIMDSARGQDAEAQEFLTGSR